MVSLQDTTYRAPPIPHVTVQSLASTSPHGVPTRKLTRVIQGTPTDVCIQEYLDRTFVIVTQVGKLGVVTQASLPTDTPFSAAPTDDGTGIDDFEDFDNESGPSIPNPLSLPPNLVQTPLLGVAPEDYTHLYSLYVSCIFSALRPDPRQQANNSNSKQEEDDFGAEPPTDERPVIVALGLKLASSSPSAAAAGPATTADIAEQQRDSFVHIIQAVRDCQNQSLS